MYYLGIILLLCVLLFFFWTLLFTFQCCLLLPVVLYRTLLTSYRYYTHMTPPAVHFRAEKPAVLSDGVALDAAKWVTRSPPAPHTEQNPWWNDEREQKPGTVRQQKLRNMPAELSTWQHLEKHLVSLEKWYIFNIQKMQSIATISSSKPSM